DRSLPIVPDRREVFGERRQRAEVGVALARAVVVRAARGEEAELAREARVLQGLIGSVAAGDDLDAGAAAALEGGEELAHLALVELVASGVRDDRNAAALADPAHRVAERRPLVGNVARRVLHQVAAEDALHVARPARLDEVAREVRAADDL